MISTAARQSASVMPAWVTTRRRPPPKFDTSTPARPSAVLVAPRRAPRRACGTPRCWCRPRAGRGRRPGARRRRRPGCGRGGDGRPGGPPSGSRATRPAAPRPRPPAACRRRASCAACGTLGDHLARAGDHRADRRREPLREAEVHGRHVPGPRGDGQTAVHGGVEQSRAVEVHGQPRTRRDGGQTASKYCGASSLRAAAPVVRVLEADDGGRRRVDVARRAEGRPRSTAGAGCRQASWRRCGTRCRRAPTPRPPRSAGCATRRR